MDHQPYLTKSKKAAVNNRVTVDFIYCFFCTLILFTGLLKPETCCGDGHSDPSEALIPTTGVQNNLTGSSNGKVPAQIDYTQSSMGRESESQKEK